MQISVLGSLIAFKSGINVTPSAPKLRQVLALLAIRANRVVRSGEIIDELWEDQPPVSAMTTLQTYVYQLRKMLQIPDNKGVRRGLSSYEYARIAAQDGTVLHTCPSGYVLGLAEQALDARRFTDLAEQGCSQLSSGQVDTASWTLHEALKCWNGPMLTDVDVGPRLRADITFLEELRNNVLEQRIEADILLGRHREVVGELTELVTKQPMHEGFQAKLMLALYRAGRRSDALEVYRRARAVLATELGLEPLPELQRLHGRMLSGDPALGGTSHSCYRVHAIGRVEVPAQLPPQVDGIVGVDAELEVLRAALAAASSASPVVVVGAPGSGKSTFVVHAAQQLVDDYPDGQFYARLMTEEAELVDVGEVLANFLRATGVVTERLPAGIEERSQLFRSWTADRKVLVVLDDVSNSAQLAQLLPSGPNCAMIVAARRRLADPMISTTIELRPWPAVKAMQLLSSIVDAGRLERDLEAVQLLIQLCGGLPLALRTVAQYLQKRPHWTADRLLQRLTTPAAGEPAGFGAGYLVDELGLRASVMASSSLTPADAQLIYQILADTQQQTVSALDAATMLCMNERTAEDLLESLVEFRLADAEEVAVDGTTVLRYRSTVAGGSRVSGGSQAQSRHASMCRTVRRTP